jgi:hypothetical protein
MADRATAELDGKARTLNWGKSYVNLLQMQPDSGGICMGVDSRNYRFAPGLPPGWRKKPALTYYCAQGAATEDTTMADRATAELDGKAAPLLHSHVHLEWCDKKLSNLLLPRCRTSCNGSIAKPMAPTSS